jgi:hypothetical protein
MCFKSAGPSAAENRAAAEARMEAEEAKQQAIHEKATQKKQAIGEALDMRTANAAKRGGSGRRSLFTSPGGAVGYLSRFE